MPGPQGNTIDQILEEPTTAKAAADVYAMPATPGQLRFWSLDQLNPGNPALNMPLMWQFTGVLDTEALERAFAACVDRHESLRTTFTLLHGKLMQIVHPEMAMPIPLDDLTGLSGEAQRLEADRITRAHAAFRFDLKNGPLLVLRLLKLGAQNQVLLVTMHHVICDGISNGILMRDMVAFYEAKVQGGEAELPELPIQFADYAVWHEQWCASDEHKVSLQFWRDNLGKDFNPIRLPHDADASASLPVHRKESTGDIETLLVPPDLTSRAHAFCIREGTTLNVLMFSIFCALLARLTGQKDLTIGSPCANRTEDTEELIGMFMNIQVLRVRLENRSTFRELLRQVHDWTLAAVDNQALPFEDLVHDPYFAKGASLEIPLFFLYQKSFMLTKRIESPAGSVQVVPLRSESPGAVFDVMFAVVDREEEGPRLQLEYNPQLYKASTIRNYLRLFVNLLESAMVGPETVVDELAILSPTGREALLTQWNQTAVDLGEFEPAHTTFLRRAASDPDGVAVEWAGMSWTNRQLASRASSLAATLVREGLQPGELVGICIGRSAEMVAAMLGVMMAGGAYVPLDARHPRPRLEMVLEDSQAAFILADHALELTTTAKVLRVDSLHGTPVNVTLPKAGGADALAYVIYTSGSTGRPKGVAIEHGALFNLLQSMKLEPGLSADDTLVAVTTLAFDIAALELLLPLLTGARLVIATEAQVHDADLLLALLKDSRATVLQATPGAWRALVDSGWTDALPLRVLCGGEAMSRDLADKLLERSSDVWNVYGPTETTIWSSATRVTREGSAPRIGPPIANTQFYILDKYLQPVPVGVDGELYIGGAGLARGYWNNPELTAARFVPNPFAAGRIYQTGDLARWHDDGSIQLLGRADFQVKIRGYRIELGEIEAALLTHPSVREAVVVQNAVADRPGLPGVSRLIAYVDAGKLAEGDGAGVLVNELEVLLRQVLPEYMTPNAIVALDHLPRNTNGKVDRAALPDVFSDAGDDGIRRSEADPQGFQGPRDIIERQLTEMWESTLGIPRISIRASFFSLGVGSLAALRLVTKMNRAFAMEIGLASLISSPSIESIAELIRNRISAKRATAVVPLQPDGDKTPLFILHGVGGNIISFYGLAMRIGATQPVYAIQAQSLIAGEAALLRMEDLAAYYLREMRKVQPRGPYNLLGYSFGGTLALEMAHQLRASGERVGLLGLLDARSKSFDEEYRQSLSVQSKVDRRLERLRGNTEALDWSKRAGYLLGKVKTRAIRFSAEAGQTLHVKKVPAWMKSAYDINYAALKAYKVKPFDGTATLFRATEQEFAGGPRDLGWGPVFKQGVEIREIVGDHERIFLEPCIDALAESLREALERA